MAKLPVDSDAMKNAVLSIRTQLTRLKDTQLTTESSQNQLEQQLDQLLAQSDLLSQDQTQRRDREADQARTQTLGIAAAAVLFGALAAWVIAGQIVHPLRKALMAGQPHCRG